MSSWQFTAVKARYASGEIAAGFIQALGKLRHGSKAYFCFVSSETANSVITPCVSNNMRTWDWLTVSHFASLGQDAKLINIFHVSLYMTWSSLLKFASPHFFFQSLEWLWSLLQPTRKDLRQQYVSPPSFLLSISAVTPKLLSDPQDGNTCTSVTHKKRRNGPRTGPPEGPLLLRSTLHLQVGTSQSQGTTTAKGNSQVQPSGTLVGS